MDTEGRIAPKNGYDFKEKAEYRERLWRCFAENVPDVSTAKVAFLPSSEGLEIPVALSFGFKEENLYAIDKNAALLAVAKWRKVYPGVNIYGSEVARAGERMAKDGVRLDACNLDLCAGLTVSTIESVKGMIYNGCLSPRFILAVTMLKGREPKAVTDLLRVIGKLSGHSGEGPMDRVELFSNIVFTMDEKVREIVSGEYSTTSKKKMVYGIFLVKTWRYVEAENASIEKRLRMSIAPMVDEVKRLQKIWGWYNEKIIRHKKQNKGRAFSRYSFFDLVKQADVRARFKIKGSAGISKKQSIKMFDYISSIEIRIQVISFELGYALSAHSFNLSTFPNLGANLEWYPHREKRAGGGRLDWGNSWDVDAKAKLRCSFLKYNSAFADHGVSRNASHSYPYKPYMTYG